MHFPKKFNNIIYSCLVILKYITSNLYNARFFFVSISLALSQDYFVDLFEVPLVSNALKMGPNSIKYLINV